MPGNRGAQRRLAGRVATRTVIAVGQIAALAAGIGMLIGALWFDTPLLVAIVCFASIRRVK